MCIFINTVLSCRVSEHRDHPLYLSHFAVLFVRSLALAHFFFPSYCTHLCRCRISLCIHNVTLWNTFLNYSKVVHSLRVWIFARIAVDQEINLKVLASQQQPHIEFITWAFICTFPSFAVEVLFSFSSLFSSLFIPCFFSPYSHMKNSIGSYVINLCMQ